jgi:NAD(P)-dependent dehydrogenase (short-subunit alcohol dehydrogenase family)
MEGKTAIVTGGSGVIGSAVCQRLLEEGGTVVVADRHAPAADAVAALGDDSTRLHFHETDVTEEGSVAALVRETTSAHGGPHVLMNIAGGFRFGPAVDELAVADWDSMLDLNLKSAFLCMKHVLPVMKEQGYGRIVSVAARSGLKGDAMVAPYAVSKGGVILLTQSVADEVRSYDITVNAVLPSIVDTPANRTAMADADFGAWVPPRELAEVMLFLASDRARVISGAAVPVYNRA